MKKTLLLLLFVGLAALGACSDDDDNNTNPSGSKIYPTTAGSYWIYNSYATDSNNVEVFTGEVDSTVCLGTETYLGKSATALMHYYFEDGEQTSTEKSYFYEENSKIYLSSGELASNSPIGDDNSLISPRWMKMYDANESDWIIFDTTFTNLDFSEGVDFTGSMTISGKKSSDASLQVNGKSVTAKHAIIKVQFSGNVSLMGQTIPVAFTQTNHAYVSTGIGLVAMVTDPTTLPLMGTSPGTATRLIRYLIK